jgi:hypothetical protein
LQFQWWRFPRASRRTQRSRTLPRQLMRRSLLVCLGHCEFERLMSRSSARGTEVFPEQVAEALAGAVGTG